VLILDEPANGLDPEGIAWLRGFLRHLAGLGRTVLVSSHVLSEVQQTVDDVVIIAAGRLVHASDLAGLAALAGRRVHVDSPDRAGLLSLVERRWPDLMIDGDPAHGAIVLRDIDAAEVGAGAFAAGVELHELTRETTSLEDVFLRLTTTAPPPPGRSPAGTDASEDAA
jgi:ABC-2 type transport system ATP-binding protein